MDAIFLIIRLPFFVAWAVVLLFLWTPLFILINAWTLCCAILSLPFTFISAAFRNRPSDVFGGFDGLGPDRLASGYAEPFSNALRWLIHGG